MNECPQCGREWDGVGTCEGCGRLASPGRCERHPEREAKGECVICHSAVCDRCDRKQTREYLCPEHHAVSIIDGWAQVYTTSDDVQAQLIRENLRAEGVPAELFSQKDHFALPVDLGELSPVRLLVPAREYRRTLDLLAQHMDEAGEVSFACPECGEAYDAGDATCRTCGAKLPTLSA